MEKIKLQEAKWRTEYYERSQRMKTARVGSTPFSHEMRRAFWATVMSIEEGKYEEKGKPGGYGGDWSKYPVISLKKAKEMQKSNPHLKIVEDVDGLVEGYGCGSIKFDASTMKRDHARCGHHFSSCALVYVRYGDKAIRTSSGCGPGMRGKAGTPCESKAKACLVTTFGEAASDFETPDKDITLDEYW